MTENRDLDSFYCLTPYFFFFLFFLNQGLNHFIQFQSLTDVMPISQIPRL